MFQIKKMFSVYKKSSKKNKSLVTDAFPVQDTDLHLINARNFSQEYHTESNLPSELDISGSENNAINVNNVNQNVVVQFSNINGLQIGSTYNVNKSNIENVTTSKKMGERKYPKTVTIHAMMKSQDEPTREILNKIAMHLGSEYKNFMRELGFSEGQISATSIDHSMYGVKEVIYQLLLEWVRNADSDVTVGFLTSKLWNSGHRECVHHLKALWKSKPLSETNDIND